jgi:hypothetical protein
MSQKSGFTARILLYVDSTSLIFFKGIWSFNRFHSMLLKEFTGKILILSYYRTVLIDLFTKSEPFN